MDGMFTLTFDNLSASEVMILTMLTELQLKGRNANIKGREESTTIHFLNSIHEYLENNDVDGTIGELIGEHLRDAAEHIEEQARLREAATKPRSGAMPAAGPKKRAQTA